MPSNNLLLTEFYQLDIEGLPVEVTVDSLTVFILGREDSVLYNNSKAVENFSIPMSDSLSFIQVVIKINDAVDTLSINYNPYSVFRSTECGVINRYNIVDTLYTKNRIKKITIANRNIDENEAVNLKMLLDLS